MPSAHDEWIYKCNVQTPSGEIVETGLRVHVTKMNGRTVATIGHDTRMPQIEEILAVRYGILAEEKEMIMYLPGLESYQRQLTKARMGQGVFLFGVKPGEYVPEPPVSILKPTDVN